MPMIYWEQLKVKFVHSVTQMAQFEIFIRQAGQKASGYCYVVALAHSSLRILCHLLYKIFIFKIKKKNL